MLDARDARQAVIDAWLGTGTTLVAASLAIPGPDKAPAGSGALFAWAMGRLADALPCADRVHSSVDALGPFELWCTPDEAMAVKLRLVAIETHGPAARLVDLDVYSPEGYPVDRSSLQLPGRACLCCDEPARDCIRARRHPRAEVVARSLHLLAAFVP